MSASAILREEPTPYRVRRIPELNNGDHLDADEYLRRYEQYPEDEKAELINGIVYIMQPASIEFHGIPDSIVQCWLCNYAIATPGVRSITNATTRLGPKDVPQPDGMLIVVPPSGLKSRLTKKGGYLAGAPDLAFEVANSSASYDVHEKLESYRAHGVREYVVWRVQDAAVDWWELRGKSYKPLAPDKRGIIASKVFPGLWLDVKALLADNGVKLMATLQKGVASAEHEAFVRKLQGKSRSPS